MPGSEAWGRFSLTASEGTSLADTVTLDFWPPELRDNVALKGAPVCGTLLQPS